VTQVRIIVEYTHQDSGPPVMRWERTAEWESPADGLAASPNSETFELLGRAFEVAQREENAPFTKSLASFFRGALIRKADVMQVADLMDGDGV
jgi:hypothetical protein